MGRLRPCIVLSCNYSIKQLQKLLSDAVNALSTQRKCLPAEPDHIRAKDVKLPFDQLCLVHTWFEKVPPGMDLVGLHMWLLLLAFCHEQMPERPEKRSHRSKTLVSNPSIIMAIKNEIIKFVPTWFENVPSVMDVVGLLLLAFCQGQRPEQERRCRGSLQPSVLHEGLILALFRLSSWMRFSLASSFFPWKYNVIP